MYFDCRYLIFTFVVPNLNRHVNFALGFVSYDEKQKVIKSITARLISDKRYYFILIASCLIPIMLCK